MKEIDPLHFLKAVYMNAGLPLSVRMRAAIELMPYTYPKLAVTAVINEHDFATLLDQRIKNMERLSNGNDRVVEAKPIPQIETRPPKPHTNDRRFRRI